MKLLAIAKKYLRDHPLLTVTVLGSIVIMSFFEGASFGMLIPLIQSMISGTSNILSGIPLLGKFDSFFASLSQREAISFIFIFIFFLLLAKNIFLYISNTLIAKLRFGIIRDLRRKLMEHLLDYDVGYFDNVKTGYVISNLNNETTRMGDFIQAVLQIVALSGRVLAYVTILFLISWKVSIAVAFLMAVILVPIELIMKKVKLIGERISQALADHNFKMTEILSGIRLIKTSGTEQQEGEDFALRASEVYKTQFKALKYMNMILPVSEVFIFGLIVISFLVLINAVKIDMGTTFPYIATYLLVLTKTLTQVNALNSMRSQAMNRLAAFTHYEDMYDESGKKTIKSGHKTFDIFSEKIEFENVNFSYIKGREVLENINLRIPKGKITALVGASGAGKSTLVNLIPRFYEIKSGKVLIDGIELKELELKKWRRKIGFVSQDVFIFNTSVKSNLSYGHKSIGTEEIVRAAKAANAHEFITELPDKYDTILGERGVKLSGGQKQRISIARAIINNPEILILDEATSSLDTETEKLITQAVNELTKDRTVVAIAHRLSTILHADNIIVLDNGRIVEEGKHADLLNKDGFYKKLYNTQFHGATK